MEGSRPQRTKGLHSITRSFHQRSLSVYENLQTYAKTRQQHDNTQTASTAGLAHDLIPQDAARPKRSRSVRESLSSLSTIFAKPSREEPQSPIMKRHRSRHSMLSRSISRFTFPVQMSEAKEAESIEAVPTDTLPPSTSHTFLEPNRIKRAFSRSKGTTRTRRLDPRSMPSSEPVSGPSYIHEVKSLDTAEDSPHFSQLSTPSIEPSPRTDWKRFSIDLHRALNDVKGPKPVPPPELAPEIDHSTATVDSEQDEARSGNLSLMAVLDMTDCEGPFKMPLNPLAKEFVFPLKEANDALPSAQLMPPPDLPLQSLARTKLQLSTTSLQHTLHEPTEIFRPSVSAPNSPRSKKRVSWHGDVEAAMMRKSLSSSSDLSGTLDSAWQFPGVPTTSMDCPGTPRLPAVERFESPPKPCGRRHRRSESQISNIFEVKKTDIFKVYRPPAITSGREKHQRSQSTHPIEHTRSQSTNPIVSFPRLPERLHNPFESSALQTPSLVPSTADGESETDDNSSGNCHDEPPSTGPARNSHEIESRALAAYERSIELYKREYGVRDDRSLVGLGIHIPVIVDPEMEEEDAMGKEEGLPTLYLSPSARKYEIERDHGHLQESWWI